MLHVVDPVDLAFALFAAFFGAGLAFSLDEKNTRPIASRLYSQFTAVVLAGILALLLLVKFQLNVGYVALISLLVGIGGEIGLVLLYEYLKNSKTLPRYITKLFKAYRMVESQEADEQKQKDDE